MDRLIGAAVARSTWIGVAQEFEETTGESTLEAFLQYLVL